MRDRKHAKENIGPAVMSVLVVVLLAGCGGGGGGSVALVPQPETPPQPETSPQPETPPSPGDSTVIPPPPTPDNPGDVTPSPPPGTPDNPDTPAPTFPDVAIITGPPNETSIFLDKNYAVSVVAGGEDLDLHHEEIRAALTSIQNAADTLLLSDGFHTDSDGFFTDTVKTTCAGSECTLAGGDVHALPYLIYFGNPYFEEPKVEFRPIMTKNGIPLAEFTLLHDLQFTSVYSYGGWLEDSFFLTIPEPFGPDGLVYSASLGAASGSRPQAIDGSATWLGVMAGMRVIGFAVSSPDFQLPIQGDVEVTVNFANADVDVAITDIVSLNADNTTNMPDIEWTDVTLDSDGTFTSRASNNELKGAFYGDGHHEVGGTFYAHGAAAFGYTSVSGAFGAKRQ